MLAITDMDGTLTNTEVVVENLGRAYDAQRLDPKPMFNMVKAYKLRGQSYNAWSDVLGFNNSNLTEAIKYSFLEACEEDPIVYDDSYPYLNFMEDRFISNLIMTNGYKDWQELKLEAAGLDQYPHLVIQDVSKGNVISSWRNSESGLFSPPEDIIEISTPSVLLTEDKLSGTAGYPDDCPGYLVIRGADKANSIRIDELRPNIKVVRNFSEISDDIDRRFF